MVDKLKCMNGPQGCLLGARVPIVGHAWQTGMCKPKYTCMTHQLFWPTPHACTCMTRAMPPFSSLINQAAKAPNHPKGNLAKLKMTQKHASEPLVLLAGLRVGRRGPTDRAHMGNRPINQPMAHACHGGGGPCFCGAQPLPKSWGRSPITDIHPL